MFKIPVLVLIVSTHCLSVAAGGMEESAQRNGLLARAALSRSKAVVEAYMKRRDPVTGLLPRSGENPAWYVRDSAADLYPFLVLCSFFTDRPVFENQMHKILTSEIRFSTRLGNLSDNVLPGGGFEDPEIDLDRLIFGSSEYAKDGLLPLAERLGRNAWFDRMVGIANSILEHSPYSSEFGSLPSLSSEVNGEMLQVLTRLAYLTGDERYVSSAISIARFYFEEVIPKSNGLIPQIWSIEEKKPVSEYFNFVDHGNEIVGGLSEIVLYLKIHEHPLYPQMARSLSQLVDLILRVGLNEDGVWVSRVAWKDYEVLDARPAHCWGYLFNGVYTAYLIAGEERFLEAVKKAMEAVTEKPAYLDDPWGSGRGYGSNAYSDSIESMIVFLNRLPNATQEEVLDVCVERFLARQREDGIIEDWYGDGNYVRTALMYAFLKSQGAWLEPWREDVVLGAVREGEDLSLHIESAQPWTGVVKFDIPRHKEFFNMPMNYPRLNEFPEWFTVELDALYSLEVGDATETVCGGELVRGIRMDLGAGEAVSLHLEKVPGPPFGTQPH
jgi:hypothetical protein